MKRTIHVILMCLAATLSGGVAAEPAEPANVLEEMFNWWNGVINSDQELKAEEFGRYFTDDAVITVNQQEQVRGTDHMPDHFMVIRERPGNIRIEVPFLETFSADNRIFTYHRIISTVDGIETITHNMGYAILEDGRIAAVHLARFQP